MPVACWGLTRPGVGVLAFSQRGSRLLYSYTNLLKCSVTFFLLSCILANTLEAQGGSQVY